MRGLIGITGASGFVGTQLLQNLLREQYGVRAFVRYHSPNEEKIRSLAKLGHLQIITGDIRDFSQVSQFMEGLDCCFHLAALVSVPFSFQAPDSYFETNVAGTLNVLEAIRAHPRTRLIFASTSEIFGNAPILPINEDAPLLPSSPYAASKAAAERFVYAYVKSYPPIDAFIVRPFNTYGPGQSPRAVIPAIIQQALEGPTINLGAITPRRDFLFIEDLVRFYVGLISPPRGDQLVFNVGSGHDYSIAEVVEIVSKSLNQQLVINLEEKRLRPTTAEIDRLLCDASRVKAVFGWTPSITLQEGIRLTISWLRNNPGLRGYRM